MNDRIKELLIQSEVFNKDGTVLKDVTGYELNKFAELIVQECVQLCQECIDDGCIEAQEPMTKIKEHFGVEL